MRSAVCGRLGSRELATTPARMKYGIKYVSIGNRHLSERNIMSRPDRALFPAIGLLALTALANALDELPRSTPEEQGVSSAQIVSFVEAASREIGSLHSFMLVRHGNVVAEGWWAPYG